jgi:hypothetical protein
MRYYFIIASKPLVILSCLFSFLNFSAQAQVTTGSPYSQYGLGLPSNNSFNGNFALGGLTHSWRPYNYRPVLYDSLARSGATFNDRNTNFINPGNPASFSNFSLTTYEAGVRIKNVELANELSEKQNNYTYFSHLAIGFPIGNQWGAAFGIRPVSNVGYSYDLDGSTVGELGTTYNFEGEGGLNEVFVGTAVTLFEQLSLGVKLKYLFGNIYYDKRLLFDENVNSNTFNVLDQQSYQINDLSLDWGAQYFKDLSDENRLIAAIFISTNSEVNATYNRLLRSYGGEVNFERIKDTALIIRNEERELSIAPVYGVGLAYEKKGSWLLGMDVELHQWEDTEYSNGVTLGENVQARLGFEKYVSQTAFGNIWKKMGYRLGMRYTSSLLQVNNQDIQEFGIAFGLAMPLRKSFSTLNLGIEVGQRGTTDHQLISEQFINIQLGVTINDKWFIKRKYD